MRISDWSSDVCSSDLFLKSVHCILEALAGLELRLGRGLDRHRFTGARVAARRCFPLCNREGSEADQANFIAFLQSAADGIKHTLHCRAEERRVGQECVSTCKSGWSRDNEQLNKERRNDRTTHRRAR